LGSFPSWTIQAILKPQLRWTSKWQCINQAPAQPSIITITNSLQHAHLQIKFGFQFKKKKTSNLNNIIKVGLVLVFSVTFASLPNGWLVH